MLYTGWPYIWANPAVTYSRMSHKIMEKEKKKRCYIISNSGFRNTVRKVITHTVPKKKNTHSVVKV
jgi:hypothetical protein